MICAATIRQSALFPGLMGILLLIATGAPTGALAEAESPDVIVSEIFAELLAELDALRADNSLDANSARAVFGRLLNPRIDYDSLARWILRDHWKNASEEQRSKFLAAFKAYIINTYSLALSSEQEIALDVEPNPTIKKNTAVVDAKFAAEDGDRIPLQFRMIQRNGSWLLFDVSFAGVSLALTFRSDFNYVAGDGGIDAVTSHLVQRAGGGT